MNISKLLTSLLFVLAASVSIGAQAASFNVGDLVASPTQINGFEGMTEYVTSNPTYTEDGIRVDQVNMGSVWTTYGSSLGFPGVRSWYANGGDYGYTQITQANGSDFGDVSVITGNGWGSNKYLNYSLLNNGVEVLSGSTLQTSSAFPVSFIGGGYDTIRLSATEALGQTPTSGSFQALAIDQIKVSAVPVPAAAWLLGSGLLGLIGVARRKAA